MQSGKLTYIGYVLLQSFFYALCNPLAKIAYRSISPLWLLAIRFSVAAALCTAFGAKNATRSKEVKPFCLAGVLPMLCRCVYCRESCP